jgi:hypothetical protein
MQNRETWNCPTCATNPFRYSQHSTLRHDEINGECEGCNTKVVRVHCKDCTPVWEQWWFPLAELLVSSTCPACKKPLLIGEQILKSDAPDTLKELIALGVVIAAIFGGAYLLDRAANA